MEQQALELIKMEIGLDVATNTTGFACFINGDLMYFGDVETSKGEAYSGLKIVKDIETINRTALAFVGQLKNHKLTDDKRYKLDCIIALESSNHANASLGQKLATYIGIYCSAFTNALKVAFPDNEIVLKLINPREWNLRAFGEVLDRKDGKATSIERAKKYINQSLTNGTGNISDDTADAINIGSLARILRDNLIVGQERKERVAKKIQNKNQILNINIKANKLLDTLRAKKAKAIERALLLKKNSQAKAQFLREQPLIGFADKEQTKRILAYKAELEKLEANLDIIKKFHIIGEVE